MRVYSSKIPQNAHWGRRAALCFFVALFFLISSNYPIDAATKNPLDGARFLLLQNSVPMPTPTPFPTPSATPTPFPTPPPSATPTPFPGARLTAKADGFFENSATNTSAGLALGSIGGIFFVLRRKDKD
ncbi:MAG: hypothetical protein KKD01_10625 [Proteobacteria bacterium]|nr:hypothetical protein [Pseudomonadota bacterium]MBU1419478.1 hypothetical protein [Pseudomonadota bacterium]MBU1455169.1 hypothetical protein [Pseudomonadota bacterium]